MAYMVRCVCGVRRARSRRPRGSWAPALTGVAGPASAPAQQPQIILLKEGTDTSQGKAQLISNINACCAVVDAVRTTLVRNRVSCDSVRWPGGAPGGR
jgi:hypothetical protein